MLSKLDKIGLFSKGAIFPFKDFPLHAMVIGAGYQLVQDQSYDWDGLKRGDQQFALFQYTLSGLGHLRYEKKEFDLGPGSVMLLHIPHNNRYRLPETSPGWRFIYICVNGSEIMRLFRTMIRKNGPVWHPEENCLSLTYAFELVEKIKDSTVKNAFEASALAYRFAATLFYEKTMKRRGVEQPTWLDQTLLYIRNSMGNAISVQDMANRAGYSRSHFSRMFEKETGMSPLEYLQNERLKYAVELLRSPTLTVKEVAYRCGFQDDNYFNKVFKKAMGMSPGNYRVAGI